MEDHAIPEPVFCIHCGEDFESSLALVDGVCLACDEMAERPEDLEPEPYEYREED